MTVRGGRLALAGLLAGGLGFAMPLAASAADLTPPEVAISGGVRTMELAATQTSSMFIPDGGTPTAEFPGTAPREGDAVSFSESLYQGERLVGTDKGVCTVESFGTLACKVIVTFADGTLNVAARIAEDEEGPGSFDLVSGTGAYSGVEGRATVQDIDETHSDITVRYTLPGAVPDTVPVAGAAPQTQASRTQVSQLPTGGAATGGGAQDHGTDTAVIIGVGVAAVAGSAGLFAAAHAAARRD